MKNYIKPSLILVVLIVLGTFVFVGAQQNQNNFNQGTGSGSGTVSANNGSAGAVANYAAAGGSTTVAPDASLVDAANLLAYSGTSGFLASAGPLASGANGGAAGVAKLFGSTSGSATCTAPAVAGTSTNGVTCTNVFLLPNGLVGTPAYSFSAHTGYGAYYNTNIGFTITANGADILGINGVPGVLTVGTSGYRIQSGGSPLAGNGDVGIGRSAAAVLSADGATIGDNAGAVIGNGGYGVKLVATAAITGPAPVKADTANANQVVITATTDTAAGIPVGVCINSPGAAGNCYVVSSGVAALVLGTGTCAIGNFVIVDTTTNGRVKCTATYTAGTVIGVAMAAQAVVGSAFNTLIGLR